MIELRGIFLQIFRSEPLIVEIPGWSHLNEEGIIAEHGQPVENQIYLDLSERKDSEFH
ncbi:hypothetical protein OQZ33_17165 [Pedobacter sp. MC2016-05]|uniref:hypothetical protein n=1 Tax=Pedobacter sp. MC2016-05 TaxID=2994474 RepID=UPI0022462807|nr:hypothetical protein [Pedobacter sp. MC2016-05]MCX2476067.1 hypothetical protein [Pedobacter sp. MC2016-05]